MSKREKNKQDVATHLSFGGSAAGGIVGSGIGSLLGPEFAAVGAVTGSSLGGSISYVLGKKPDWYKYFGEKLTVESLIIAKLSKDFSYSVIHEHSLAQHARDNAHSRIILLEEVRKRDFARFTSSSLYAWLKKNIPEIRKDLRDLVPPEKLKSSVEILKNLEQPIQISCECIEPAAVATLKSLQSRRRFNLNIEIDYEDTSGVYQIMKASDRKNHYDFIITASAPFFLFGDTQPNMKDYRLVFELHGEEQVILKRRGWETSKKMKIHVFGDSSAEEQFLIKNNVYSNTEPVSHRFFEELKVVLEQLNPGELVIAWEPLASVLSRNIWIKRSEDAFINWISLFCQKKWNGRNLKKEHEAFRYLFIYEWLYCKENQDWAGELLINDSFFRERFSLGAGLTSSGDINAKP